MKDRIAQLLEEYGFLDLLDNKKEEIPKILQHFFMAYELFYGSEWTAPPIDLIKNFLMELVRLSPQYLHLVMDVNRDTAEKCVKRFVEMVYDLGENELTRHRKIIYI